MKSFPFLVRLLVLALLLGACVEAPQDLSTPAPSGTPTRTPTQTGTILWFPPTRTPRPIATVQVFPTPDQRPAVGEVLLKDDFTQPGQWTNGQADVGVVSYGDGELTLAVQAQKGMLVSLRNSTNLSDFYLELTSSLSLCRGPDNYGLLVRATSVQDYYRFLITCDGQIRLERVKNGKTAVLQEWMYSGQVPPGSPLVLKLGVWVVKTNLRFFINDVYQFSASDTILSNGSVGVYARSNGITPVTVSFSDLVVHAIHPNEIPLPTPTFTLQPTATRTLAGPTLTPTPVFMHSSATPVLSTLPVKP